MLPITKIAREYLRANSYTVYRRSNGSAVTVKAVPLHELDDRTLSKWGDHLTLQGNVQRAKDLVDYPPQLKGGDLMIGYVEENKRILHGYFAAKVKDSANLISLYSAPWNYAARIEVTSLGEIWGDWRQDSWGDQHAVKGTGWTMVACLTARLFMLERQTPSVFPLSVEVDPETDAIDFYLNVVGFKKNKEEVTLSRSAAENFLRSAWFGEQQKKIAWQSLV